MNRAQEEAVETLRVMMPGASFRPDPFTTSDGDALYGDGSVLVHVERRRPGNPGPTGAVVLDRGGSLLRVQLQGSA